MAKGKRGGRGRIKNYRDAIFVKCKYCGMHDRVDKNDERIKKGILKTTD